MLPTQYSGVIWTHSLTDRVGKLEYLDGDSAVFREGIFLWSVVNYGREDVC